MAAQHPDGKKILQQISRETGGGFFEVTKKEPIDSIYKTVQEELRNQYSIGYVSDQDPSGTGFPLIVGDGRPDRVPGVSFKSANRTINNWLNPAALATPANNIGRFGNDSVGNIPGIGTEVVSGSLIKSVRIAEGIRLQIGAQVANLFNHVNLAQPSTSLVTGTYGTVSNVQTAEGAGPRAVQLTGRFTF